MRAVLITLQRGLRPGIQGMLALALVLGLLGVFGSQSASAVPIPLFVVSAVEKDNLVTIKTTNFPANKTFVVRMDTYGAQAVGGIEVGTTFSGTGGTFTATYSIPDALKGVGRIAIRLDATSGGYYSYNWFWNGTAATTGTGGPYTTYTGVPTFQIMYIVKDSTVTIKTHNFPANKTFTVRMGKYGTLAIGGSVVGSTYSEGGGTFTISYAIPEELKGQSRIAIRLDSTTGGYSSYNWFWNDPDATTATFGTGGPYPTYTGVPTFVVSTVVKDDSVTITTNNYPADRDFVVRMGKYGTLAIGGTVVATANSDGGGALTATFSIPDELKGESRIAIRLDSTTGGFYSYNWFWNN